MQKESEDYNGRQTPDNFNNLPGAVFQLHEKLSPGEAYAFLASDSFHKTRKAVAVKHNLTDANKSSVVTDVKKSYQSPITTIKLIATTAEKDSVFLAQLAPVADTLTVLLIAKSNASPALFIQEFKADKDIHGQFPEYMEMHRTLSQIMIRLAQDEKYELAAIAKLWVDKIESTIQEHSYC